MNDVAETAPDISISTRQLVTAVSLFVATFIATTYVGAHNAGAEPISLLGWFDHLPGSVAATARRIAHDVGNYAWGSGLSYSVPLMSILLAHELGHFIAARIHRVPASPPFFVPMPLPPLGTMGAVILMRERIPRRDALLDIGAAGPLAGLCVAIPVLAYGIATSPVSEVVPNMTYTMEGRSLLYVGLLYLLKGPIPEGSDIMLSPTAFAGWAGLLVTMINLIPAAQLDGGHVAYALFGKRQDTYSRRVRALLLPVAVVVSLAYGVHDVLAGVRGEALQASFAPGVPWLLWWGLLRLMTRTGRPEHPPTDDDQLSPGRRVVAIGTLLLFVLLFMPAWIREVVPSGG
jgi:membrane-associated protease RseP (regulator of RpoE activity)